MLPGKCRYTIIWSLQDQPLTIPDRGKLRRNARTNRFSINDDAIGGNCLYHHFVNDERIRIKYLFGSFSGRFAKSGIIHHPYFISKMGKIGGKRCIAVDIASVPMKIYYCPTTNTIRNSKPNDIQVDCLYPVEH